MTTTYAAPPTLRSRLGYLGALPWTDRRTTTVHDTDAAVREAERQVREDWSLGDWEVAVEAMPLPSQAQGTDPWDWLVTVALLRQPWETPADTAERLARYICAATERWHAAPTMRAVRLHAFTRRGAHT